MKLKFLVFSVCLFTVHAGHAAVAESPPDESTQVEEHKTPGWQPPPATVEDWADRCTDFTINGWGFKDPKNFVKLVNTFSEPAIYLEYAQRALDPKFFFKMLGTLADPATAKNYLEWTDPVIYTRWAAGAFDPGFYTDLTLSFADPGKYLRWMTAPLDPRWWSVALNTMNPAVWVKWMTAPLDPEAFKLLAKVTDPNTPLQWSQVLTDSKSYPETWSAFLTPLNGGGPTSGADGDLFQPWTWQPSSQSGTSGDTGQK